MKLFTPLLLASSVILSANANADICEDLEKSRYIVDDLAALFFEGEEKLYQSDKPVLELVSLAERLGKKYPDSNFTEQGEQLLQQFKAKDTQALFSNTLGGSVVDLSTAFYEIEEKDC